MAILNPQSSIAESGTFTSVNEAWHKLGNLGNHFRDSFGLRMLGPFALTSFISSVIVVTLYRLGTRKCLAASVRQMAEVLVAVAVGAVVADRSSWCDPDVPISVNFCVCFLASGIVFGLWGRCSPLVIGPATGLISIYWAFKFLFEDMAWGSAAFEEYEFEVVMFLAMLAIVSLGVVIGRVVRRYLLRSSRNVVIPIA